MFKIFILLILIFASFSNTQTFAYEYQNLRSQAQQMTIFNALDLSEEQTQCIENILEKNSLQYAQKFDDLMKESYKAYALESCGASKYEIFKQNTIIKKYQKDFNKILKKEDKLIRKCLTQEQRAKYSMIKKLERDDLKKSAHKKDYQKSNPRMEQFGNPKPNLKTPSCQCN